MSLVVADNYSNRVQNHGIDYTSPNAGFVYRGNADGTIDKIEKGSGVVYHIYDTKREYNHKKHKSMMDKLTQNPPLWKKLKNAGNVYKEVGEYATAGALATGQYELLPMTGMLYAMGDAAFQAGRYAKKSSKDDEKGKQKVLKNASISFSRDENIDASIKAMYMKELKKRDTYGNLFYDKYDEKKQEDALKKEQEKKAKMNQKHNYLPALDVEEPTVETSNFTFKQITFI
jgi:hypothetical protein